MEDSVNPRVEFTAVTNRTYRGTDMYIYFHNLP